MSDATGDRELAERFDLKNLPADFYANPFRYYRALRDHAPVKRLPDGSILATRYADVAAVYRDAKLFSSDKKSEFGPKFGIESLLYQHHTTSLVFNDPPFHSRVRRLIVGALVPRAITDLAPGIEALVDTLLDEMQARREVDLVEDFALAIPVEIVGNLFGMAPGERKPLRGWTAAILGALEPALSAEQQARGNQAVREFLDYLRGLIADRRAHPRDPERDVLTRLIQFDADGEQFTEVELLQNCIFIINAGHETTTSLLGSALVLLREWPQERRRLQAEPGLMKSAIDEFLRMESPVQLGNRLATADTVVGGVPVTRDTIVHIGIGAANRDPAQFADPERLDISRSPNRHFAFAGGIHQCAGNHLAKLQADIALARFLARFPNYELAANPTRGSRARFRGYVKVPARVM
ncbi:MAG: cytochrome P450 [Betaproteobacteria bacterium]|nr:cytochrome P450 [Betaproteobacteria bacterium]